MIHWWYEYTIYLTFKYHIVAQIWRLSPFVSCGLRAKLIANYFKYLIWSIKSNKPQFIFTINQGCNAWPSLWFNWKGETASTELRLAYFYFTVFLARKPHIFWIPLTVWTFYFQFTGRLDVNHMYLSISQGPSDYICLFWVSRLVVLIKHIFATFNFLTQNVFYWKMYFRENTYISQKKNYPAILRYH